MNNQPEQQTIPGLPRPDERGLIRIEIDHQNREAAHARKDMKDAAMELTQYMDANLRPDGTGLEGYTVLRLVSEYREAQKKFLLATAAAGDAAMALRREENRLREERAAEND